MPRTVREIMIDFGRKVEGDVYCADTFESVYDKVLDQYIAELQKVLVPTEKSHPKLYHYVCHGGSCVGPMVDKWGNEEVYFCNSAKPDGGWINAPNCKTCTGNLPGVFESPLTEREKAWNACRTEILKRFDNQPTTHSV